MQPSVSVMAKFRAARRAVTGDFEFTANLSAMSHSTRPGSAEGHVGVILCSDCQNASATVGANVKIGVTESSGLKIMHFRRLSNGGSRTNTVTAVTAAPGADLYLRVSRTDSKTYTLSYSTDGGTNYVTADTRDFTNDLPAEVRVGVYGSQGGDQGQAPGNTITFENITLIQD
jgi:hypothetical protein